MKYLGIDYGTKRVGVAVSSDDGTIAFPEAVLQAGADLADRIAAFASDQGAETVVLGESLAFDGTENPLMEHIRTFKKELEEKKFKVVFEPEFLTSVAARRVTGETAMHDASAAALILQSYLDRARNG
jgi:putative holliday junction resolvase